MTQASPSYLRPSRLLVTAERLPNLSITALKAPLPGITGATVEIATPFSAISEPGDKMDFETLDVTFLAQEDLSNWLEVYQWMRRLYFPSDYAEHESIQNDKNFPTEKSDITLTIMNNMDIPKFEVIFRDAFPIGLTKLDLDSTTENDEPIPSIATFGFTTYDIIHLG